MEFIYSRQSAADVRDTLEELIVVSIRPLFLLQLQLFYVERCKVEGNSIVYGVDNVNNATDRRISTNIIHNSKI